MHPKGGGLAGPVAWDIELAKLPEPRPITEEERDAFILRVRREPQAGLLLRMLGLTDG